MKLNAVSVIEYFSETVQSVHSFTDDPDGNKEAEKLFKKIAKENGFSKEEIEVADGLFRENYQLYIVHST